MNQQQVSFFGTIRRFFRDYVMGFGATGFGRIMHQAETDPAFRRQLIAEPNRVLAQAGIRLPNGIQVEVFENTQNEIHVVLPPFVGQHKT